MSIRKDVDVNAYQYPLIGLGGFSSTQQLAPGAYQTPAAPSRWVYFFIYITWMSGECGGQEAAHIHSQSEEAVTVKVNPAPEQIGKRLLLPS